MNLFNFLQEMTAYKKRSMQQQAAQQNLHVPDNEDLEDDDEEIEDDEDE